jgi:hypothetical protein
MRLPEPNLQLRFFFQTTIVMILGLLGLVGFLWFSLAHTTARVSKNARSEAVQEGFAVARAIETSLRQNISNIDVTLRLIQAAYRRDPEALDLEEWRQALAANMEGDLDLGLVGADGVYRASTARRMPNPWDANVADRAALSGSGQYWVHLNLANGQGDRPAEAATPPNRPFALASNGNAFAARKPHWVAQFTKPLYRPNGEADGSVVLSADLSYLVRALEGANPHRSVVALIGPTGQVWGRQPLAEGLSGGTIGKPVSAVALDAMRESDSRVFEQEARLHAGARQTNPVLYVSKRVADTPFYVLLGFSIQDRFQVLDRNLLRTIWSAVALTGIAFALIVLLIYVRYRMARLEFVPD